MADTPNTDLLNQFRHIVREEIEAEAKTTRVEIDRLSIKQTALEYNVSNKIKNVEITTLKLEKGQKGLETGQQDIKSVQQEQGKKLDTLEQGQKAIREEVRVVQAGQNTLELKTEALHAEQRQANKEIVVTLHEMHQVDTEDTNRRLERREKHVNLPPAK